MIIYYSTHRREPNFSKETQPLINSSKILREEFFSTYNKLKKKERKTLFNFISLFSTYTIRILSFLIWIRANVIPCKHLFSTPIHPLNFIDERGPALLSKFAWSYRSISNRYGNRFANVVSRITRRSPIQLRSLVCNWHNGEFTDRALFLGISVTGDPLDALMIPVRVLR